MEKPDSMPSRMNFYPSTGTGQTSSHTSFKSQPNAIQSYSSFQPMSKSKMTVNTGTSSAYSSAPTSPDQDTFNKPSIHSRPRSKSKTKAKSGNSSAEQEQMKRKEDAMRERSDRGHGMGGGMATAIWGMGKGDSSRAHRKLDPTASGSTSQSVSEHEDDADDDESILSEMKEEASNVKDKVKAKEDDGEWIVMDLCDDNGIFSHTCPNYYGLTTVHSIYLDVTNSSSPFTTPDHIVIPPSNVNHCLKYCHRPT